MSLRTTCLFIFLFLEIDIQDQILCQNTNPFEINKTTLAPEQISEQSADSIAVLNANPFLIRPAAKSLTYGFKSNDEEQLLSWINRPEPTRIKLVEIQSLLFWTLLFLSFLLAIALNINRSVTIKLYRSLLNLNFLNLLYRESKEENLLIYYLLYGLYFIGMSLFVYLTILHFKGIKAPVYILQISLYIMLIYGLRHLLLKIIGTVYGLYRETDRYLFSIIIFSCIMSILLIPADFIIAFVNPELARKCIWLIFIIFIVLYLYRQFREILFSFNLWRDHIFHFLLYLCTFEIAPLVMFLVFLSNQGVI